MSAEAPADAIHARLSSNIEAVSQDPSTLLDVRAFEEAEIVLPKTLQGDQRVQLIQRLAGLLTTLQQDATPAINLLFRFLEDLTYTDVLNFGALPFTDGLAMGEHMVSYNRLMLTILGKATEKPADAAQVASMLDTMLALVRLWLCTTDTGIASQASKLLLDLLRVDQEVQTDPDAHLPSGGQGLVWKRIFGDSNVYATFFEACSLRGQVAGHEMSKNQHTLAQARLLEWLPTVGALDWSTISKSHHPDIEKQYSVTEGLLEFAAAKMVDYKDDVLMHRCLVDFYSDLLHSTKPTGPTASPTHDSAALRYLITAGLHARTTAIYLQVPGTPVDPLDAMFLYGPAANYIATYASVYSDHFLASQMPKQINERLMTALNMSSAKWAHAESPKHDLHLLASLPRKAIFPQSDWKSSPLSYLPSKSTNADVLNTLAAVFHGPEREVINYPPAAQTTGTSGERETEAACARALYFHYLANNPRFWNDIATHADTIALKELALAAINCLTAVITANWSTSPDLPLPNNVATPEGGQVAILSPPALEYALPYLLKPSQSFANLVGGRGDTESAAYKIALAKFDALKAFHSRLMPLAEHHPDEGYDDILKTISKKLAQGPLNREGEVGGRIGTMEL